MDDEIWWSDTWRLLFFVDCNPAVLIVTNVHAQFAASVFIAPACVDWPANAKRLRAIPINRYQRAARV